MSYKNANKHRQMKIKNSPAYLFNDNLIVNIKDFDSRLLKIYKLSFKCVFSLNIYCINPIQDGHFRGCSRMRQGGGKKATPTS